MSGEADTMADDDGMMDLFRVEVSTHVSALETGLVDLEGSSPTKERIEPLMRAAHSIKGAARIMGLDIAVHLAHAMEDLFVAAQEGRFQISAQAVDQLLRGIDLYKRLSVVDTSKIAGWLTGHAGEFETLKNALVAMLAGGGGANAAAPAPAVPAPVPEKKEAPKPSAPAAAPAVETDRTESDSAVLVTADTLNRLMGLAGECMVESHRLQDYTKAFLQLKDRQYDLLTTLSRLTEQSDGKLQGHRSASLVKDALEKAGQSMALLGESLIRYENYSLRSEELTTRLYNEAISARMRPFSDGIKGFPRLVRDLARQLNKKIKLRFTGESAKVDRDILARLEAPLNHLLRNACDHGIEMPADRLAAGKPEEGAIVVDAAHKAGMLFITVSDDGKGIDQESVRRKIVEKKLAGPEMASQMSEAELMDFLFLPGFSTTSRVTEISGRGVGMDVVQNMVQVVGGTVRISSKLGKGSSFQMQLPLTLSVLRALIVDIAGQPYAFHLSRVDRVLKIPREEIRLVEDRQYYRMKDENIGLIPAYLPLALEAPALSPDSLPVVVISDRMNRYGVVVDQLRGERELVVRPLDARLGKIPDINSSAILDDGSPVLILDVDDLVRSIDHLLNTGASGKITRVDTRHKDKAVRRVLVVDDSITVREVERRLLENHGFKVDVAVDGMDGWNRIREAAYDLVISDIDMPRMNGIEMVTRIKRDQALKNIPVMIVSYKDREEDRLKGLEAGANYYLTKSSFHDESLLDAVRNLLGED
ncbi:MAG: hybrid sensor histidine kinase/response regulator [Lentisphaerota bacterium]